jgi:hypothetical protein
VGFASPLLKLNEMKQSRPGRDTVRRLSLNDSDAYTKFRSRMWPVHSSAGPWENVQLKYFLNPHIAQCPESGLYGYFRGSQILGIIGAYPTPVTLNGTTYPGHMFVDWAVLPEHQYGPAAGYLWNSLLSLPGRKLATIGSGAAQRVFEKRAVRIRSGTRAIAVLRPWDTAMLRFQGTEGYAAPSPLVFERISLPRGVQIKIAESFQPQSPFKPANTAYVVRDRDFWSVFCSGRLYNGAAPVSMQTPLGEAQVVMRLLETGRLRYAILMAQQFAPATIDNARNAGALLRDMLREVGVAMVRVIDVDELTSALIRSLSSIVFRRESAWYGLRRPSDTFQIEDVRWWLTHADEDSHWEGFQPTAADKE